MRILKSFSLNKKNLLVTIVLCTILVLALFVRFYQLSSIPSGFHIDEASLGYNAYSLLLTGKDSDGNKLPLYISMFNDNNPTGYYYMAAASIKFFGLNEFATRFPAALFGSLSVLAVFLLGFVIFRYKKIAVLGALLTALSPWNIVLSRASAETLVALFFTVLGFSLVILSFRGKNISYLLLGTASLFASLFIYPAPRVFVPLFFLLLAIFYFANWFKDSNTKYRVSIIGSFLFLVLSSVILVFFIAGGTARFSQVSIFSFPETKLIMAEQIKEDGVMGTGATTTRLFHNKIVNYSLTFASNYFQYFTGDFLFIKGGLPLILRVPNTGLVLILELPFLLWGIISIAKNKNKFSKIILLWLLVAPVASALTVDDSPNVRRALIMFPAIEILAAYGFFMFMDNFKKNKKIILSVVLGVLLFFNSIYFMHQYFVHAQIDKNWYRNVGFKHMVAEVEKNYSSYDTVIVTKSEGGIAPLILFYSKYNPVTYQNEGSPKDKSFTGFGKFFFADAFCPFLDRDVRFPKVKKTIYVENGDCRDDSKLSGHKIVNIFGRDEVKIFRIVYE
jgi:4-amino-4-deoxy-L-arabinose transferase-like glycosyltransferase